MSSSGTKYKHLHEKPEIFISCKNKGLGVILLSLVNVFLTLILVYLLFSAEFSPSIGTYKLNNYKEGKFLEQSVFFKDLIHINNNNHQLYIDDVVFLDTDVHVTKLRVECLKYYTNDIKNYYFVDLDDINTDHTCEFCHNTLGNNLLEQYEDIKTQIVSISSKFINPFLYIKVIYLLTFIILFIILLPIEILNFSIKQNKVKDDNIEQFTKIYNNFFSSLRFYFTSGIILHCIYLVISLYLMANY